LRFFKKLIRNLRDSIQIDVIPLILSNNTKSHEIALKQIKESPDNSLILILCHGGSNYIHGCSFRCGYSSHPKRYQHEEHGAFIDIKNIQLFSNKKIISVSCNSDKLGEYSISSGAEVFIGFNEINFDQKKYMNENRSSKRVIATTKWMFRRSLYWSLLTSFEEDLTVGEFYFKLIYSLQKLSTELILTKKNKYTLRVAYSLNEIRNGIKIMGNAKRRMFG
jgi:hypothetical protein